MSEQPHPETSPKVPEHNQEQSIHEKKIVIERLSVQLGFVETSELKELRAHIVEDSEIFYLSLIHI